MSIGEMPAVAGGEPLAVKTKLPMPLRLLVWLADTIVIVSLAAMVVLPLLDILFRKLIEWRLIERGISGSTSWVQHGSLIVGLMGGVIAARENRLLSLATTSMFRGRLRTAARIFSGAVGAVIAVLLVSASVTFLQLEREAGSLIAYGVPVWTMMLVMPLGFGLIALLIVWNSADQWIGRSITALPALIVAALCFFPPELPEPTGRLILTGIIFLLVATALGTPIFVLLGGAAIILFWGDFSPISSVAIDHYSLVTNATLPTIPLFTLAGYFLAEGGASRRLVRVFTALFSNLRGGPAIVTVVVCAFFTSFTGASGVTILAMGGLLMPVLLASQYSERNALGLVTGAGALGMLFPPCLPLILYAIIAEQPIQQIFLAAVLPGVLLVLITAAYGVLIAPRRSAAPAPFSAREAALAVWQSKWELLLPAVAMYSLFSGWATVVEAAAITALYAFITQTIIWRDLRIIRDVPRVIVECALVVGGVLLILGVAKGLTNYLIFAQIPDQAVEWVTTAVQSPFTFLLLLNVFLLIVGCLMDVYSAIIVVVPLLVPIAARFGIDPLHLGIIFLANLELGYLTPPVGMNLFLASYRFNKPMAIVARSVIPILLIQLIGVLIITYVPPLTTWLPAWWRQ